MPLRSAVRDWCLAIAKARVDHTQVRKSRASSQTGHILNIVETLRLRNGWWPWAQVRLRRIYSTRRIALSYNQQKGSSIYESYQTDLLVNPISFTVSPFLLHLILHLNTRVQTNTARNMASASRIPFATLSLLSGLLSLSAAAGFDTGTTSSGNCSGLDNKNFGAFNATGKHHSCPILLFFFTNGLQAP